MRAVRYHDHGGPDVLTVENVSRPTPGYGEVLVKVQRAAVNPVDTYFRDGSYPPPGLPMIPGADVAGVVEVVGPGVEAFEAGDRVVGTALGNNHQGTCADFVTAPVEYLTTLPDTVTFDSAAGIALVGVTAYRALVGRSGLQPGEHCLVHGGSGGVGHIAVQLAAATGATVTTTASARYHERLVELGADTVFDYSRDDLESAVAAAGAPDVILDHRLDDYLGFDQRVAAQGGRIAAIGNTDLQATFEHVPNARGKELTVNHVSMFNTPDVSAVLDRLLALLAGGDIETVVHRTYDLDGVAQAQQDVLDESYLGKLLVAP